MPNLFTRIFWKADIAGHWLQYAFRYRNSSYCFKSRFLVWSPPPLSMDFQNELSKRGGGEDQTWP
jgi:hypothetical protein